MIIYIGNIMLTYISNDGRLGENISYIYGLFKFCKNNNIAFDNIVIDYNYKSKSILKNKQGEYIFHDSIEMFDNIKNNFVDDINLDNFKKIDLHSKIDISELYNFFRFNNYKKTDNIVFKNYWSLSPYFLDRSLLPDLDLLKYICYPKKLVNKLMNKYSSLFMKNSIGIHIRREDYCCIEDRSLLKDELFENYSFNNKKLYTIDDIKVLIHKYRNCNILIFSDDCMWCKNNFKYDNVYIIDGNKPYVDMILLSLCDNVIENPGSFFSLISKLLNTVK